MVNQLLTFLLLVACARATKETTAYVFSNRNLHQISERFLSVTSDPKELLDALPIEESSFNMMRGLSPMFIRLGGPSTNTMVFGKAAPSGNWSMSGKQWSLLNELAKSSGAELVISLNAEERIGSAWDSKNSMELISYSNAQPFEVGWQLGYSLESLKGVHGKDLGRDSVRLRMILSQFPFYKNAPILSPDVRLTRSHARSIHDFLSEAGSSINAIPVQMSPAHEEDDSFLQTGGLAPAELDQIIWGSRSRKPALRHPVWIAESESGSRNMSDALAWVVRLGAAARAGYQVVLRKLDSDYLAAPHPDFWVSLLFKNLVGREVLDAKTTSGSKTLYVYSHCSAPARIDSALGSIGRYQRGAMTVFGVNRGHEGVKLNLRATFKDEPVHIYAVTANEQSADGPMATYLNGQELLLSPSGEIPTLSPRVKKHSRYPQVLVPPRSVFFIVFPESRLRTCINPNTPYPPDLTELTRKFGLETLETLDKDTLDAENMDAEPSYVSYKSRTPAKDLAPGVVKPSEKEDSSEKPAKYTMFNHNDWLNKPADSVIQAVPPVDKAKSSTEDTPEDLDKKFDFLTAAIYGLKNLTKSVVTRGKREADGELLRRKRNATETLTSSCSDSPVSTEVPKPPMQSLTEIGVVSKAIEEPPTSDPTSEPVAEEKAEKKGPFDNLAFALPPSPFGTLSFPDMPTLGAINEEDLQQGIEDLRTRIKEAQERILSMIHTPDLTSIPKNKEEWDALIQRSPLLRLRRYSYLPEASFEDSSISSDDKAISKRVDPFSPFFNPYYGMPYPYMNPYGPPFAYPDVHYDDYGDHEYFPIRRRRSTSEDENMLPLTQGVEDNSVDSKEWFKEAEVLRSPDEAKVEPEKRSKVLFFSFILDRIKEALKIFTSH